MDDSKRILRIIVIEGVEHQRERDIINPKERMARKRNIGGLQDSILQRHQYKAN